MFAPRTRDVFHVVSVPDLSAWCEALLVRRLKPDPRAAYVGR